MNDRKRIRILLADHDPGYRESVRRLLEQAGFEVTEAVTREEALEILISFLFDLAIVESNLIDPDDADDTSGLELAELASINGTPIIISTAFPSIGLTKLVFRRLGSASAIDMASKADGPQWLLEAVNRIILDTMTSTRVESKIPHDELSRGSPKLGSLPEAEEDVHFTALHTKEGVVEAWQTLLVYVHIESALDRVRADARRFTDEIQMPKEVSTPARSRLKRGIEITIVPACEGVTFNPERTSLKWLEDFQRADFRFRAAPSLKGDAASGQITFYVGPMIVGTLKFAMLFDGAREGAPNEHEVRAQMYHHDKIFISYSHKDTGIALAFKKVHEATGHDVLIDIDDLRSGEEWNPALMRLIDKADIFQLFWSENSKSSKFCKQEWDHALKRGREGFIRPVYWQRPLPDPPMELSRYHFEYVEL